MLEVIDKEGICCQLHCFNGAKMGGKNWQAVTNFEQERSSWTKFGAKRGEVDA
jgi:hypothetical protein